jgi:hypothetical protein
MALQKGDQRAVPQHFAAALQVPGANFHLRPAPSCFTVLPAKPGNDGAPDCQLVDIGPEALTRRVG